MLVAISIVIFVVPPWSNNICVVRSIGFHCSVNLIYTPLCMKNILIYRIFMAGTKKIRFKSTCAQMTITGLTLAIQVNFYRFLD